MRSWRESLKSVLQRAGLYGRVLKVRRYLDPKKLPYRFIRRYKATINGITVQFNTSDEYSNSWFFPRYAGGRFHEKAVTEMIVDTLKRAHCFVDVGTHLGWFTCLASKHMPEGVVYGFEMDDMFFDLLLKNVQLNHCDNVKAYNVAVTDAAGTVKYRRDSNRYSSGFRLRSPAADENEDLFVSVESIALDDLMRSEGDVPDVIKIDVEGAEMNVLRGMTQILRDHRPILFLEVHPGYLPNFDTSISEILSLLAECGYEVFEIEDLRIQDGKGKLTPVPREAVIEDNAMLFATTESMNAPNAP